MKLTSEIVKLFDAWNKALQTLDPDKVVELYASNAILLPTVSNQVRHNHAEIKDYFVHFLRNRPKGKIDEYNVRRYGDFASNSGLYTFTLSPPSGDPSVIKARYTFVYQWFGDRWLIVEHHSSRLPEPTTSGSLAQHSGKTKGGREKNTTKRSKTA